MKSAILVILNVCFAVSYIAQKDSSNKLHFSGFQLEIGTNFYPEFNRQYQEDYQKFVKNDPNLQVNLSDYKNQNAAFYRSFTGLLGLKFFAEIQDGKKLRKEIYVGIKYGQEFNTGAYYSKSTYDTVGIFIEPNTNRKLTKLRKYKSVYNYGIHSQKLIVPLGFNFSTNKEKFFWITYGIEIAPAINFGYQFTSNHQNFNEEIILEEGDTLNSGYNYGRSRFLGEGKFDRRATKLKGLGYGCSAALPIALYFHPLKKINFVKHINLFASLTPAFLFTHTKYSGSAYAFNYMLATGIRVNW
jgi:hypothetical protein